MTKKVMYDFVESLKGKPFYAMVSQNRFQKHGSPVNDENVIGDSRGSYFYVGEINEHNAVDVYWYHSTTSTSTHHVDYSLKDVYDNFMKRAWVLVEIEDFDSFFQDLD